jgi:hypothetical protein
MGHVNNLVDGHYDRLRVIAALRGEGLNGHRDVFKDLRYEIPPDQLALNHEQEKENITAFIEQSQTLFKESAAQENPGNESVPIIRLLPKRNSERSRDVERTVESDLGSTDGCGLATKWQSNGMIKSPKYERRIYSVCSLKN